MKRMFNLLFVLPVLLLGMVLAQVAPTVGGVTVPDEVWYIAATVIGLIVKAVASPLTALLKKRFGFEGSVTQAVYLVLSVLFVTGFGLLTGAFGQGGHGWLSALTALAVALVKGFGDHTKLVQTSAAGALVAGQVNTAPRTGLEDLR